MTRAKPALNPFYTPDMGSMYQKAVYKTKMFEIFPDDENAQKVKYESFMQSLFPYTPDSTLELNPSIPNNPTKTWTKEGSLLIFIEYIEMVDEKPASILSTETGAVSIEKIAGGEYVVTVNGVGHDIPSGVPLRVKNGSMVGRGDVLAGTDSPAADNRQY